MASEYTVCVIPNNTGLLGQLESKLRSYDRTSDEIEAYIALKEDREYQMPGIYSESIERTDRAIWFEARRGCGNEFILWLLNGIDKNIVYASHCDCGNDDYAIYRVHADGTDEYIGGIDAYQFVDADNEQSLFEDYFVKLLEEQTNGSIKN